MAPFFAYKPRDIGYGPPRPPDTHPWSVRAPAPPKVDPYSFGPRTPNLVGVGATRTPTPTRGGTAPPPRDPWTVFLNSIMGSIETPAQQEARVNREIDAQIAAQKKLLDDEYARQQANALRMYQAQAAAGSAAAAMSGDLFNAVGGEYNAAAGEIKGLSHALTGSVGKTTAAETGAQNAALGAVGNAPVVSGGGAGSTGPGGSLQQGVEDYRGGTLGAQLFKGLGEGAQFGLAGLANSDNLRATQEANAALISATHDINDAQSKAVSALAAGRADLFHTYMNDANDAKVKFISLAQGLIAQRAASTGVGVKPITRSFGNSLLQWDTTKQQWAVIATKPANPTKPTTRTAGGIIYQWDPKKQTWVNVAGTPTAGAPTTKKFADGWYQWDPSQGGWVKIPGKMGGTGTTPTTKGQLTRLQISNMVQSWATGKPSKGGTVPVVTGYDKLGNPKYTSLKPGQTYKDPDTGKNVVVPGTPGGTPTGQRKYAEVARTLAGLGVNPAMAKEILNTWYRRGDPDSGRPALSLAERNVLKKAGLQETAHHLSVAEGNRLIKNAPEFGKPETFASRHWLSPAQVRALQAAGVQLNGWWLSSGTSDYAKGKYPRIFLIKETYQ